MRRSTLLAVAALSVVALASACATSPTDDIGNAVQETKSAEPAPEAGANTTTLPTKQPSTDQDSGTSGADSATAPDTGSTSSSSGSSGTSSSGSSGSSSSGSSSSGSSSSGSSGSSGSTSSSSSSSSSSSGSSGAVGPACDVSNPLKLVVYQIEVSNQSSPVPCPCAATQCCYLGVTCIAP